MKLLKVISAAALALGVGYIGSVAHAATPVAPQACDRACLKNLADTFVDSIVARDTTHLPLTQTYAATENSVASALNMMVVYRTATAVKGRFYIIDSVSKQVFMIVSVAEGPNDTLLFGRLKADGTLISEVEIYENRSRGQGGFQYSGLGPANLPEEWTKPVPAERLPSRQDLLNAGLSIFDTNLNSPSASDDCVLMENGKIVAEHSDIAAVVVPADGKPKTGKAFIPNADGTVPIPCGVPPGRPTDPKARTNIIDQETGFVVSMATVHGSAEPYLVTTPTESAFVPYQMLSSYAELLKSQRASGKFTEPAMIAMDATGSVAQVERIYDGKIQAMHLLVNLGAPGSHSPWVK